MFEHLTGKYEGNNSPMDDKEDGREEWVAAQAIEVRNDFKLAVAAIEWDMDQTGSDALIPYLARWWNAHSTFRQEDKQATTRNMHAMLQSLAEDYADQVLWPQYVAKVKNGDFEG